MQIPPSPKIFETSDVGISPETVRQPDTPGRGEEAKCNFSKLFLESPQTSKFTNVDKKTIRLRSNSLTADLENNVVEEKCVFLKVSVGVSHRLGQTPEFVAEC